MSAEAPAPESAPQTFRLGILLSGRGSNFLAIAQSIREGRLPGVEIAVVISNVADAPGLAAARELGLNHDLFVSKGRPRADHDADVLACLRRHHVNLVCLAGYMRLLSPGFIAAYPNRILNIHPSLLPAFPGLEAQQQAFDYGVKVAGCTVHFVDEHLDHGVIVLQRPIPVLDSDDAHSLAGRILAEEHIAYTEAIARVASGNTKLSAAATYESAKPHFGPSASRLGQVNASVPHSFRFFCGKVGNREPHPALSTIPPGPLPYPLIARGLHASQLCRTYPSDSLRLEKPDKRPNCRARRMSTPSSNGWRRGAGPSKSAKVSGSLAANRRNHGAHTATELPSTQIRKPPRGRRRQEEEPSRWQISF